ncbi:MAG: hypothetical protein II482_01965, partial [Lachnospiraceae bacterium]|nr:hypothetical protein [Lachnospiraceae bacterium]
SDKYAEQAEWYYGARNEAQEYLKELNEGSASGLDDIEKRFPAGDKMELIVTYEAAENGYRVRSEKLQSVVEYDLDESLHVMK